MKLLSLLAVILLTAALSLDGQTRPRPHGRLFPPQDLGLLEAPDRDDWQYPDEVMDRLGIADGSIVADIGAGSGWFTIRLARRVGPRGLVFAEDVQPEMISAISRRAAAEGLRNIRPILGKGSDPRIAPNAVHAVLLVDAYHEIEDRVTLLRNLARALRPGARLGVIDFKLEGSGPGPAPEERVSPETVIEDARQAGLTLQSQGTFLPYQYFLIFGRTVSVTPSPVARNAQTAGNTPLATATSTRS